jgi:hypothetical protein
MSETVEQIIEKTDRVEFDSQNSMTTKINETKQPFWKVWERQEDMSIDPHDFPALKKRLILFTIAMAAAM